MIAARIRGCLAGGLAFALAVTGAACSSGGNAGGSGGAGGSAGAGGATGNGGSSGAGGAAGKGGSSGAGGAAGAGGVGGGTTDGGQGGRDAGPGTGGAGGTAADAAIDVAPSDGGGTNDGSLAAPPLAGFDTTVEGFTLSNTELASDLMGNLVLHNGGTAPTLTWDGTQGDPSPGALKVTAPYSDFRQYVEVVKDYGTTNLQDWSGKTRLSVRFKLASGFIQDATSPGHAVLYTRSYTAASDGGTGVIGFNALLGDVTPGGAWQEMSIALDAPSRLDWDKSKVTNFAIRFDAGQAPSSTSAKPTPAVIYVDTFTLE
jgi:hypothetical protein